jgi:hypothetical protein
MNNKTLTTLIIAIVAFAGGYFLYNFIGGEKIKLFFGLLVLQVCMFLYILSEEIISNPKLKLILTMTGIH